MKRPWNMPRRSFLLGAAAAFASLARPVRAEQSACAKTPPNPLGPFYLPGAPERSDLAPPDFPGDRLRISGQVLSADGCTPLEGAMVDVWHAGSTGFYYGLEAEKPLKPEQYLLRGRIRTDTQGRYAFDTIVPGNYRITDTVIRPRHIHYRVTHPAHAELVTQLYFYGDPFNRTDRLVQPELIIPLTGEGEGENLKLFGTFDLKLSRS